jgi:predicted DNA-binding transcriptional regulator AlpA
MARKKHSKLAQLIASTNCPAPAPIIAPLPSSDTDNTVLVPGPKLRRMLGISAVTLWRWRHDARAGFPPAKSINGRLYFPWRDVSDWLARQQQAA